MPPKIFVVVLNWNLPRETVECVRSVKGSTYGHFETLVVDNGSIDNSREILREQLPGTTVLTAPRNLGYAGGNNLGIRMALENKADQVLLLNNDTVVDNRMLAILAEAGAADPTVGILSPAVYYCDQPQRFWRLGAVQRVWCPLPLELGRNRMDRDQYRHPLPVTFVTGCAMWVRREVFEAVGLLDEGFFMYYEDADFCLRAGHKGWCIQVIPQAKIWHKVARSSSRQAGPAAYYRIRNRIVFYNRYQRGWRLGMINGYLFFQLLFQILLGGDKRKFVWAGYQDGRQRLIGEKIFPTSVEQS